MQSTLRYNTDIPDDNYFKYREKLKPLLVSKVFYGSDRDIVLKVTQSGKAGAFFACASALIMYNYEQPGQVLTASKAVERILKHSPPFLISGIAYGLGVGFSAKLRDKDGPLNHIIGGLACGTMMGSWYKSPTLSLYTSIILASLGGVYKMLVDGDYLPVGSPRPPRNFNMYRTGWFTERPDPEGIQDAELDDTYKRYKP